MVETGPPAHPPLGFRVPSSSSRPPGTLLPTRKEQNILVDALQQVLAHAASGELRVQTERVRLTDIENDWLRTHKAEDWQADEPR